MKKYDVSYRRSLKIGLALCIDPYRSISLYNFRLDLSAHRCLYKAAREASSIAHFTQSTELTAKAVRVLPLTQDMDEL